jgi:glycosyltransferase involved in cell wall biosynthesis
MAVVEESSMSTNELAPARPKVLVVTPDTLGKRMAGPAIRAWEMSKALSEVVDVKLASTVGASIQHDDFEVIEAWHDDLRPLVEWADVVVIQGHILRSHPWIKKTDKIIVADIYDPMHLEQLEQGKELPTEDRYAVSIDTAEVLNDQIERADFMLCASEKQRDFWLGQLAAMTRINPATYDQDPSLRSLLDVAPFGVSNDGPVQKRHAIKGAIEGISATDKVIIWGGGIYNWFDPVTLVAAVGRLAERHDDIRLFFLGVKHPNPDVPEMSMALRARELSGELGLLGKVVFFNEGWVPYEDRADYLLDADLGVSTHLDHLETAFSFRTRILDYLWSSLPIVSTDGDTFAELILRHDLGRTVPPEDVDALVDALEDLLYDDDLRAQTAIRVEEFAHTMTWQYALEPLIRFCRNPHPAADHVYGVVSQRNQHVEALNIRIRGLERSASWRITKPLRMVSTLVRRRGNRV